VRSAATAIVRSVAIAQVRGLLQEEHQHVGQEVRMAELRRLQHMLPSEAAAPLTSPCPVAPACHVREQVYNQLAQVGHQVQVEELPHL
jgi:hypothetical protein